MVLVEQIDEQRLAPSILPCALPDDFWCRKNGCPPPAPPAAQLMHATTQTEREQRAPPAPSQQQQDYTEPSWPAGFLSSSSVDLRLSADKCAFGPCLRIANRGAARKPTGRGLASDERYSRATLVPVCPGNLRAHMHRVTRERSEKGRPTIRTIEPIQEN